MERGDRLPSISLERAEGDGAVNLRHGGRDATVIVKLPATDAARFLPYLERLAAAEPAFRDWSGRLLVVVSATSGGGQRPDTGDGPLPPAEGGREGGADRPLPRAARGREGRSGCGSGRGRGRGRGRGYDGDKAGGGRVERLELDTSRITSLPFPVLRDDARATSDWASAGQATVVIADRFGVVYHEAHGADAADLPDADEIIEWLRYLATQCPECGVPDEPGLGEFA